MLLDLVEDLLRPVEAEPAPGIDVERPRLILRARADDERAVVRTASKGDPRRIFRNLALLRRRRSAKRHNQPSYQDLLHRVSVPLSPRADRGPTHELQGAA